ncbi:dihydrofolate reductase family protein [Hyphomonas sp.]|uniref:dihydrofolate reductase family protein n=1 Tax=Hyphomonas sp. TaxID=87 RepID=UPI00391944F2
MRKLIAAMKVSLDGMVADANGDAFWVEAWSEDYGLTPQIDACLLGAGMYPDYERYWTAMLAAPDQPHLMSGNLPTPAELDWCLRVPRLPHYVLSSVMNSAGWANTSFLRSLQDIEALKQEPGKDIYLVGGARMTGSLIEAGLVDELRLITSSVVAGGGTPLFAAVCSPKRLRLKDVASLGGGRFRQVYEWVDPAQPV